MTKPKPDSTEWWREIAQGLGVAIHVLREERDALLAERERLWKLREADNAAMNFAAKRETERLQLIYSLQQRLTAGKDGAQHDRAITLLHDIVNAWEGADWCADAAAFLCELQADWQVKREP